MVATIVLRQSRQTVK